MLQLPNNKTNATLSAPDDSFDAGEGPPSKQLFLVMQGDRLGAIPVALPLDDVDTLELGRGSFAQDTLVSARSCRFEIPDGWMSTRHARLSRAGLDFVIEDCQSKNGTYVGGILCRRRVLVDQDVILLGQTFFIYRDRLPRLRQHRPSCLPGMATMSPVLAARLEQLASVAASAAPVLVRGETGTGKELVARAIHELSGAKGAFVAVNCGALPANLIEGELFGYRKGAFSGADRQHDGLVRAADGGTLFLDEIGDLPASAQTTMLRVLQEKEVLPIGEVKAKRVDFRVVAATHRDLPRLVEAGAFRRDLFARLNGYVVMLPPLRERREDLGLILQYLIDKLVPGESSIRIAPAAVRALLAYPWPLNIRELERCIELALALSPRNTIKLEHLPDLVAGRTDFAAGTSPQVDARPAVDEDEIRRDELAAQLLRHAGNISAVAREMGKSRVQIRRWMKRFGVLR